MKRQASDDLLRWKNDITKTPLFLYGNKGVGKTYLALEFGKNYFEGTIYINFEIDSELNSLFKEKYNDFKNPNLFKSWLLEYYQFEEMETLNKILFIFDEIDYRDGVIDVLYNMMDLNIIMISSMLNPKLLIPKEKNMLQIYPLDFNEFLMAIGDEWYADIIYAHFNNMKKIPDIVHREMNNQFNEYLITGGYPAAVNEYIRNDNNINIHETYNLYTKQFISNVNDFNNDTDTLKIKQIYESMPGQIYKQNRKFQFTSIRRGATYNQFKSVIDYMDKSNYIIKCNRIELDSDKNEEINNQFKIYANDTGILNFMIRKNCASVSDDLLRQVLCENYMANILRKKEYDIYFWESSSLSKVDFIVYDIHNNIIPIDIKAIENKRLKSLNIFTSKFDCKKIFRITDKNFEYNEQTYTIPLYAAQYINLQM